MQKVSTLIGASSSIEDACGAATDLLGPGRWAGLGLSGSWGGGEGGTEGHGGGASGRGADGEDTEHEYLVVGASLNAVMRLMLGYMRKVRHRRYGTKTVESGATTDGSRPSLGTFSQPADRSRRGSQDGDVGYR